MAIITNQITKEEIKAKMEGGINNEDPKKETPEKGDPEGQKAGKEVIVPENASEPEPNADAAKSDADAAAGKDEPAKDKKDDAVPQKEVTVPDPNDLETRYKESSRESLVQLNRSRNLIKTAAEAISQTVTDEEVDTAIKTKFTDDAWSELTTGEQLLWKESTRANLQLQKQQEKIKNVLVDIEEEDTYVTKVDGFIDSPDRATTYPGLNGREEDFRKFCMNKNHRSTPLDTLADYFVLKMPIVKNKQSVLNGNSGGGIITAKETPQNQTMSSDDIKFLMKNSPKKYNELVKSGVIKAENLLVK